MDANLDRGTERRGDAGNGQDERDAKRRRIETSEQTITDAPPSPASASDPSVITKTSDDTAWIITGTDTEDIIIYDLQTRAILQRIHSRTFSLPEDERQRNRAALRNGEEQEPPAVEKVSEGVKIDEREEVACLAVAGHPFRRELAVGGLGGDCVVRIWRDGAE